MMDMKSVIQCTVLNFQSDDSDDSIQHVKKKRKLRKKKPIEKSEVIVFGSLISISAFVNNFQLAEKAIKVKSLLIVYTVKNKNHNCDMPTKYFLLLVFIS